MRFFVTGASGLLGSSFLEAAALRGHAVATCVRRVSPIIERHASEVILRDILEVRSDDLPRDLDAVVHFASGTDDAEERMTQVAVQGTLRTFRAAQARRVPRFVHISSMSVYPGSLRGPEGLPGKMRLEPHPERRGAYARSKTLAELELHAEAATASPSGIELIVIRPGLVFAPRMKSVLAGTAIELPLGLAVGLGRPNQHVALLDLADMNAVLLALLAREPRPGAVHVYDLASGHPPTKGDVLAAYRRLSGRGRRVVWIPRPLAVLAAGAVDTVGLVKGRPAKTAYAVRRMYDFDPAGLSLDRAWQDSGERPRGTLHGAMAKALSGVLPTTAGVEIGARARATSLLGCAVSPPHGPAVPLVLVGAGRIAAEMHVPALHALSRFDVRAVVDADVSRAKSLAASLSKCSSAAQIDEVDVDWDGTSAVIATPGFTHFDIACDLLSRGASLLIEKPAVLTSQQLVELRDLVADKKARVTVFQNYRLRPGVRALWRFLAEHDVGRLLCADVLFHSPRIESERARWMHDEKRHRTLVLELATHFLDLAFVVGGELTELGDVAVTDDRCGQTTLSVSGVGTLESGASLAFDLDAFGSAQRTQLALSFERSTCVVDFFPDGFRVLPHRNHPLDDLAAAIARSASAVSHRLRPNRSGVPRRVLPHWWIYGEHLRCLDSASHDGPFALNAVAPSLRSLLHLADRVYADLEVSPHSGQSAATGR